MMWFQSLIGRLQTRPRSGVGGSHAEFQSLIGRLQTARIMRLSTSAVTFQSLIGRLQTTFQEQDIQLSIYGFNPS